MGRWDDEETDDLLNAMCETCIHKVSASDIEQIRADAIDEMVNALGTEPFSAYVMDIIYHWQKKLKEHNNGR